jgi:phage terminase small subunit
MSNLPKPTALKMLQGTDRRDRANPAEPQPSALVPGTRPPPWLHGARRRRAWATLVELLTAQRLLTVMDQAALAVLVDAYGDYLEAGDLITGIACGLCGLPVASKKRCTAPPEFVEDKATGERHLVRPGHEPGRRYYTTTTENGSLMIRPHPAMAIRSDAWKRVVGMLDRFGMTPSSRTKVSALAAVEIDPLAEWAAR